MSSRSFQPGPLVGTVPLEMADHAGCEGVEFAKSPGQHCVRSPELGDTVALP